MAASGPEGTARKRAGAKPGGRYHHGDLRTALVAAGRAMVEAEGEAAITLRAVARAAGVSQAAPYHHFRDKTALLAAVASEGFIELAAALRDVAGGVPEARQRLDALGAVYVRFARRSPGLYRLMQGPALSAPPPEVAADAGDGAGVDDGTSPDPSGQTALSAARTASAAPLFDCVREALPDAEDDQWRAAAAAAWALVHGLATLVNDGRLDAVLPLADEPDAVRGITRQLDITRVLDPG